MDKREFIEELRKSRRVVIKIGSGVISKGGAIERNILSSIVSGISYLKQQSKELVIVSSGAVACGMSMIGVKKRPDNIVSLQALASIGQPNLMYIYQRLFNEFSIKISQVLVTVDDIQNRRRFINAKNAIITLLKWGIIPIVNENDTVVIRELRFGDNDNLSFHILNLVEGDALIILSNIDGVYNKNPKEEGARFIEKVTQNVYIEKGMPSNLGTGGIKTKIEALLNAAKAGKLACIINGKKKDVIRRLFEDKDVKFSYAEPSVEPIRSKKSWILNCSPNGVVVIDDGAVRSIKKHKSLLPSGIIKIYGGFDRGDIINIEDKNGILIAKGITNYDSSEIEKIKGFHSNKIVNILGYKYSNDVVHIDDMVVIS